jgi:hypothetical protein
MLEKSQQTFVLVLIGAGVLAVGAMFGWVVFGINLQKAGPELTLPLVVILGVVVLLVTLGLVAVSFSALSLSDKAQALALPEGSVRAVIALMLLVVFAIIAIYLYGSIAGSGKVQFMDSVPQAQEAEVRRQINVVAVVPSQQQGALRVYYKDVGGAGDDIAKQLIVLLGTLVTAVASFYFGSSSVASAQAAAARGQGRSGGPNATGVDQTTLKADGSLQELKITGSNLGRVKAAKLVSSDGKTTIRADAESVTASETEVICKLTVPTTAPTGAWDVVVSDNANNDSTLPKGVSIIAGPQQTAVVAAGKVEAKSFDKPTLDADGLEHDLTITGTGLGNIAGVKLVADDGTSIEAAKASIKCTETQVSCKVTISTTTKAGPRDVVVYDDAKNESKVPTKIMITTVNPAVTVR